MSSLDILLLALVAAPTLLGLWRGMLWPVSVVAGLVAGCLAAVLFHSYMRDLFTESDAWVPLVSALIAFLTVFLVVQLLRVGVRRILSTIGMKWIDHLAGAIVAGSAASIIVAWAVSLVPFLLNESPPLIESSVLAGPAGGVACATGFPCEDGAPTSLPRMLREQQGGSPSLWQTVVELLPQGLKERVLSDLAAFDVASEALLGGAELGEPEAASEL